MLIPITEKNRNSGYLTWSADQEKALHVLLRGLDAVRLIFEGEDIGVKKINRKTRRISLGGGQRIDAGLRHISHYKLTRQGDVLIVNVE